MRATLRTVPNWEAAWQHGYLPWLRAAVTRSALQQKPVLMIAPDQATLRYARSMALDAGIPALAIHFVTPAQVRQLITDRLLPDTRYALRETLRLLLAIAAEASDTHVATAVAAAPDNVLRAIDSVGSAGWDFAELASDLLKPLLSDFHAMRQECGFSLLHETDATLRKLADPNAPLFSEICLIGFDAAHLPFWPILATAVQVCESATVMLRLPGFGSEELDTLWIGTWEEEFGASEPLIESADSPEEPEDQPIFYVVGEDTAEQASAIVQQALLYLADPNCKRLAIFLPGPGALARLVATGLEAASIPHYDEIARQSSPSSEDTAWEAWLDLQESPRLPALARFLRSYDSRKKLLPDRPRATMVEKLTRLYQDLLIDDIEFLAAYDELAAEIISAVPRLPASGLLGDFIEATSKALARLGWKDRATELQRLTEGWSAAIKRPISLRLFIRWLREVLSRRKRERHALGNHPYSRTHLLPASRAGSQTFTHLIFAGLNEGSWPPSLSDSDWLNEEQVSVLNRKVRTLNRRSVRQGKQGEGHETVLPGKGICLGPAEKRALIARDFHFALESARSVTLCASIVDEKAPDRLLNPSEFLLRAYFDRRGVALSHAAMAAIQEQTREWLHTPAKLSETAAPAIHFPVRQAYDARRDRSQPFGEYEFALRTPPDELPELSVTEWGRALKHPSTVWLGHFLGVGPMDDPASGTPWHSAIGNWVHRWLSAVTEGVLPGMFDTRPPNHELLARVGRRARAFHARVHQLTTPPEWWDITWHQAQHTALLLAGKIGSVDSKYSELLAEWRLPENSEIDFGDDSRMRVRGRIDLLLKSGADEYWLVDYKTGRASALSVAELRKGNAIQVALYALALEKTKGRKIGISQLTPELQLEAPQLMLEEFDRDALEPLWKALASMGARGVFGAKGEIREEFGYADPFPLATLMIAPDILDAKWSLTHPDFAVPRG